MVFLMVAFMCVCRRGVLYILETSFLLFRQSSITLKGGDAGEYIKITGGLFIKRNLKYPGKPS